MTAVLPSGAKKQHKFNTMTDRRFVVEEAHNDCVPTKETLVSCVKNTILEAVQSKQVNYHSCEQLQTLLSSLANQFSFQFNYCI